VAGLNNQIGADGLTGIARTAQPDASLGPETLVPGQVKSGLQTRQKARPGVQLRTPDLATPTTFGSSERDGSDQPQNDENPNLDEEGETCDRRCQKQVTQRRELHDAPHRFANPNR
jgi:hypothetical protein